MTSHSKPAVPATQFAPECVALLHDASAWRLIGLLLSCPRGDWRNQLLSLAAEVNDDTLHEAAQVAQRESDQGMYDSAFGPGGPAPPREVSYRPPSLSSEFLAELSGHYQAFGYVPPYAEPADHVAVEADFVAYLKLKEAFAVSRGDADQAATAREAAERLQSEHLAHVAAPLAEKLATSDVRYLALASAALAARTGSQPASANQKLPVLADVTGEQPGWTCCSDEVLEEEALDHF